MFQPSEAVPAVSVHYLGTKSVGRQDALLGNIRRLLFHFNFFASLAGLRILSVKKGGLRLCTGWLRSSLLACSASASVILLRLRTARELRTRKITGDRCGHCSTQVTQLVAILDSVRGRNATV
jgi:hypothetical protein